MRALRSALFVPGHKADWIRKALSSEADAVIIDLEDAVPASHKAQARANARDATTAYDGDKSILIRTNGIDTDHFGEDLYTAAVPGLDALLLPMVKTAADIIAFDGAVTAAELHNGVPRGTLQVVPSFETAEAVCNAEDIVAAPRVGGVMAAAAKDADVSRALGFRWTAHGDETLYLRSRILTAARAAHLEMITLGLWQSVKDLDGLRTFAHDNAGLGYTGQVIIHPTHAAVVNEEYGISEAQIDYYQRLVDAFERATREGDGAVSFEGQHIDLAHAQYARQRLRQAGNAAAS